ncbi:MAG: hypothetical protein BGP06_03035 [Rhizobiales bacterium 65-9]|nr:hypothetical protein [Hyphomicrobiales bacterium]OJY35835.1 MAG: hypothetical protein BGP06_03035 [Rhizobiales bacterium 65-9]
MGAHRKRRHSARHLLTEHLVAGRTCGDCAHCCDFKAVRAPGFFKPAGERCPHSTGCSCAIYETRPEPCRGWHCLWRRIEALPDEARPDLSGVAFEIMSDAGSEDPLEHLFISALALDHHSAFQRPEVQGWIGLFIQGEGNLPVFASWRDHSLMIYPAPDIAAAARDETLPPPPGKEAAVERWRQRLHDIRAERAERGLPAIPPA